MSQDNDEDMLYRLAEQQLVDQIARDLHLATGNKNCVSVFGWLVQGFTAILAGNRDINLVSPVSAPLDPESLELVGKLWSSAMSQIYDFCEKDGGNLNEVQFKYILLRVHDMLFHTIYTSVVSARQRQAPDRV